MSITDYSLEEMISHIEGEIFVVIGVIWFMILFVHILISVIMGLGELVQYASIVSFLLLNIIAISLGLISKYNMDRIRILKSD